MIEAALQEAEVTGSPQLAVAFSGGRDSTALLHAVWRQASAFGVRVHALHVHHGLSPRADVWERHCRSLCRRWSGRGAAITFQVRRVRLERLPGASIEALARAARYAALEEMAKAVGCRRVLLAHHAQDQAETFLLQALRGAGPAGLAAMPDEVERQGIVWCRPWLAQSRRAIDSYVQRHRLSCVEDESNASAAFARNRLRLQVWPALEEAFPQVTSVLGRAVQHAQDAAACLDALAQADLRTAAGEGGAIDVARLLALGGPRLRNTLRLWLRAGSGLPAPASLLERLSVELTVDRSRVWPVGGDWQLRSHRGRLLLRRETSGPAETRNEVGEVVRLCIDGPGRYPAPGWAGSLRVDPVPSGGVALTRLATIELRPRRGGEQFQRAIGTPPRALKKQFQAADVPAWMRRGPLLHDAQGHLLYVPGLGLDARVVELANAVPQGDAGRCVNLVWLPEAGDRE